MKKIFSFLFYFLSLIVIAFCRVQVQVDGSLTITPANSQGNVIIDASQFIAGTQDFISEISNIVYQVQTANRINLQFIDTLRFQLINGTSGYESVGFVLNGETYFVGGSQLYLLNASGQIFIQSSYSFPSFPAGKFEYAVINNQSHLFFISNSQTAIYQTTFSSSGWSTPIGPIGYLAITSDIKYFSLNGVSYLAQATAGNNYILQLTGTSWIVSFTLANNIVGFEYFSIGTSNYLATAISSGNSQIYQLASPISSSTVFQQLPSCNSIRYFSYNQNSYLVLAQSYQLALYILSGNTFTLLNVNSIGANKITAFSFFGGVFIATDGGDIYEFSPAFQTLSQIASATGVSQIISWSVFNGVDGTTYAFLNAATSPSYLYKLNLE